MLDAGYWMLDEERRGAQRALPPFCRAVMMPLSQSRRDDRCIAHGVSRGTRATQWPSPVRGVRDRRAGTPPPSSHVSYAPDGAGWGGRGDPRAYALGYASSARERAARPCLHGIRHTRGPLRVHPIQYPTSAVQHLAPCAPRRESGIWNLPSGIQYPVSSIQHRASA